MHVQKLKKGYGRKIRLLNVSWSSHFFKQYRAIKVSQKGCIVFVAPQLQIQITVTGLTFYKTTELTVMPWMKAHDSPCLASSGQCLTPAAAQQYCHASLLLQHVEQFPTECMCIVNKIISSCWHNAFLYTTFESKLGRGSYCSIQSASIMIRYPGSMCKHEVDNVITITEVAFLEEH